MSLKVNLSENEKLTLYGLVKYPHLQDKYTCDILGLKYSTFSNIKNKLKEQGVYFTVNLPNFPKIGLEFLAVYYGFLNRATTIEQRLRITKKYLESFAEDIYIVSESNQAFNISVARNFTDYEKNNEVFNKVYRKNNFFTEKGFEHVFFPFEISVLNKFFDYAPLLSRVFDIHVDDDDTNKVDLLPTPKEEPSFSMVEKKVIQGLVDYPDLTNTALAEKINVSRNTISKLKAEFLEQRLIIPKNIPNLAKLGFEILMFSHRQYNPVISIFDQEKALKVVNEVMTPFVFINKQLEGIVISAFRDYNEFQSLYSKVHNYYTEENIILREPFVMLLSIPNITIIKNLTFSAIVKKALSSP